MIKFGKLLKYNDKCVNEFGILSIDWLKLSPNVKQVNIVG